MEPLEPDPGTARADAAQAVTRRLLPDGRWLIEMADERGRVWSLPLDNQALGVLLRRYIHKHGELARPVHRTFARHGRLDELRLLVLRCVEGESVDLVARALALGPGAAHGRASVLARGPSLGLGHPRSARPGAAAGPGRG
jgi:hypothetical protein